MRDLFPIIMSVLLSRDARIPHDFVVMRYATSSSSACIALSLGHALCCAMRDWARDMSGRALAGMRIKECVLRGLKSAPLHATLLCVD